jgi:hypothetical protein
MAIHQAAIFEASLVKVFAHHFSAPRRKLRLSNHLRLHLDRRLCDNFTTHAEIGGSGEIAQFPT